MNRHASQPASPTERIPRFTPPPPKQPTPGQVVTGQAAEPKANTAKRRTRPLLTIVGWPLLVIVAVVLYLRSQPLTDPLTVAVVGIAPLVGIPLALAVVVALVGRSRALRTATAIVGAAYLAVFAPLDAAVGCGGTVTEAAVAGETVTILTANLLVGGAAPDEFAAMLAEVDPDIVVMQELRGDFLDPLRVDPAMAVYQSRTEDWPNARRGTVVWSKWPITDVGQQPLGINSAVEATIESPIGSIDVVGVHLTAPAVSVNIDPWHEDLAALSTRSTNRPTIIAGDFNATEDHLPFRQLLDRGWSDVHDNKGCGFDATWPSGGLPIAVMRLDHILLTDHLSTKATQVLPAGGSDHHPVVATIELAG